MLYELKDNKEYINMDKDIENNTAENSEYNTDEDSDIEKDSDEEIDEEIDKDNIKGNIKEFSEKISKNSYESNIDSIQDKNEYIKKRFLLLEQKICERLDIMDNKIDILILYLKNKEMINDQTLEYNNQWDNIDLNIKDINYDNIGKMFQDYSTELEITKLLFSDNYPFKLKSPRIFEYYNNGKWLSDNDGVYICKILFNYFTKIELKINSMNHSKDNLTLFIENQSHICKLENNNYRRHFMKLLKNIIN